VRRAPAARYMLRDSGLEDIGQLTDFGLRDASVARGHATFFT